MSACRRHRKQSTETIQTRSQTHTSGGRHHRCTALSSTAAHTPPHRLQEAP
eukprot:NODE_12944_length_372_cov_1.804954_g11792_i0.p5 GENE.NODE_12944_length_372_cov_1.804954_g11792_i0~~NODE_12944_length_372_cov_1.804954_g11792_i0.p5  ORF type:complete len:51 (+),score=0.71 NODE_12944_length_372_cov_1.804954_g11792_i0:111-263(+)